jgi:putative zinc finger/helix-turn-helix YgiT family protein
MKTTVGRHCHRCKGAIVLRYAPPSIWEIKYDGAIRQVPVERMPEWHCTACDASTLHDDSDEILQEALRKHMCLLRPMELRDARKALDLDQKELAELIGCASESLSRWETGSVVQSRAYDRLLRLFFYLPEARDMLKNLVLNPSLGSIVVLRSVRMWSELAQAESNDPTSPEGAHHEPSLNPELYAA